MEWISLEKAQELILSKTSPIEEIQRLPLNKALGFIAGETIHAPMDNPPFDRSPLDGFALRSGDTPTASADKPVRLRITGVVYAGGVFERPLVPGEAVRIMTGAAMPLGADCMVPLEDVRTEAGELLVFRPVKAQENYVFRGEDIPKGEPLVQEGEWLGAVHLGLLASMGMDTVPVLRAPRIGLLCTGDELTPAGQPLAPGKIYSSNDTMLSARLEEFGFHARLLPAMADDAATVAARIAAEAGNLDMFITTGAVSVGDKDIMPEVFTLLGAEQLFWRVAFKPGSAVLCGVYRNTLLLCLSGNPFASFTSFELLARPALAKLARRRDLETRRILARLKDPFLKKSPTRRFIRAKLTEPENRDLPFVSLPEGHSSGQIRSLLGCNCFVDIPAQSTALNEGSEVEVVLF
ncbi:molybdopterin biosynthesis protein MoeA [Treponema primitia ZAS-2]|uniref:Molybdopterin molybdenumtransferase n=1 Tax=Treponema primitia (strain ATCC BAA-887 / DSM 12427 / ZAS-2) TaxID=545694 RepID=D8L148_TREPZ|nr:gephyrin-like molybdotransferase Glp [Treponema primitia]ADJ19592.1 putative molybdopterin biosynthesis protein A [Treponema primitia ZAS-2]AEF86269.1 molybdopterin biosynthesis protein MoeA [Treponema primitia ZAS-2]